MRVHWSRQLKENMSLSLQSAKLRASCAEKSIMDQETISKSDTNAEEAASVTLSRACLFVCNLDGGELCSGISGNRSPQRPWERTYKATLQQCAAHKHNHVHTCTAFSVCGRCFYWTQGLAFKDYTALSLSLSLSLSLTLSLPTSGRIFFF